MEKKFADVQYVIVPAKMPRHCQFVETYNRIFDFWHSRWKSTYAETGKPEGHWPDHFLRQDLVVALMSADDVIGCHLYTFYNLDAHSTLESEYFHYLSSASLQHLKSKKFLINMSMEYLCVDPEWKRNSEGISMGKLLVALGTYVSEEAGADCALGMPIGGTKVDQMSSNVGGYTIQPDIQKFGYRLQLMVMPTQPRLESQDKTVGAWARMLWDQRQDFSGLGDTKQNLAKVA